MLWLQFAASAIDPFVIPLLDIDIDGSDKPTTYRILIMLS
jgi:hypothetical protein